MTRDYEPGVCLDGTDGPENGGTREEHDQAEPWEVVNAVAVDEREANLRALLEAAADLCSAVGANTHAVPGSVLDAWGPLDHLLAAWKYDGGTP